MCKCCLRQVCFCILVFCKELGLCGKTNLNSNPDSAFSLLCDLEPSILSFWASVSLSLYVCNYTAYVCVCVWKSINMKRNRLFSFLFLSSGNCVCEFYIWQIIILLTVSASVPNVYLIRCYGKCGPQNRFVYL